MFSTQTVRRGTDPAVGFEYALDLTNCHIRIKGKTEPLQHFLDNGFTGHFWYSRESSSLGIS